MWKILVVEDDKTLQEITKMTLQLVEFNQKKIHVLQAFSSADAISILNEQSHIAVIFLDIKMETREAGIHVLNHVRNHQKNKLVRIVVRTGQQDIFPEHDALTKYDIDDYRDKKTIDANALITITIANLKTYAQLSRVETLDRLCRDLVTSHIPQLMLTVTDDKENRLRELKQLAKDNMTQPIDVDKFKARIQSIFSLKTSHQEGLKKQFFLERKMWPEDLPEVELDLKDKVFVERWEKIVERHYVESSIRVEKLAEYMCISSGHLLDKLKSLIGIGPKEFLDEYRISKAKHLLKTRALSIADIAETVGFNNQRHFSTTFKKITGLTPSEFRSL